MTDLSVLETLSEKQISHMGYDDLADLLYKIRVQMEYTEILRKKITNGLKLRASKTVENALRTGERSNGTIYFKEKQFLITAKVSLLDGIDKKK
jgi:hypothetical protein